LVFLTNAHWSDLRPTTKGNFQIELEEDFLTKRLEANAGLEYLVSIKMSLDIPSEQAIFLGQYFGISIMIVSINGVQVYKS
jgi:hypothetical protein